MEYHKYVRVLFGSLREQTLPSANILYFYKATMQIKNVKSDPKILITWNGKMVLNRVSKLIKNFLNQLDLL